MKRHLPWILFVLCIAGVTQAAPPKPESRSPDEPGSSPRWRLVWSDEFDDAGLPSKGKWDYEVGMIRNHEAQYYTKTNRTNTRVANGQLIIEARHEPFKNAKYTSGSLKSKRAWKYGRIEVRAKLPTGRGMWPAIWMMPENRKAPWPACGEIDIMENVGFEPNVIHATVHTKSYNHVKGTQKGDVIKVDRPYAKFCVYAVEWNENKMDFFLNDTKYFTFKNEGTGPHVWPFDKAFYLKLNIAVGGGWGGQKGIDNSIFPQQMLIDYVRVYQQRLTPKVP